MTEPTLRFPLHRLLLAIVLMAIFFLSLRPTVDPDYGWHVANGRHVLDGVLFAGRDVYSWTAAGRKMVQAHWLSELTIASINDTIGPTVNSLLASAVIAGAFALVAIRLRRRRASVGSTMFTVFLGFTASLIGVGVRVQMVSLFFSAAALLLIDSWLSRPRPSRRTLLITVACGTVVWVNSHGSYPLLLVFLLLTSIGLLLAKDARWRWYGWATFVASLAVLINPAGVGIYRFSVQSLLSKDTKLLIEEWRPPVLGSFSFVPFDIELVLIGVAMALILKSMLAKPDQDQSYRSRRQVLSIAPRDTLIAGAIVYLAFQSARHVMLVGICAAPMIAYSLDRVIFRIRNRTARATTPVSPTVARPDQRGREMINFAALTGVAVVLGLLWWPLVSPAAQQRAVAKRYPVGLLTALRSVTAAELCVFNEYNWGGFLEEHDILPVFIDGRSELYGDAQLVRYGSIIHLKAGWQHLLDSLGVDAIVMSSHAPLTVAVRKLGWTEIARDTNAVLLIRPEVRHAVTTMPNPTPSRTCPRSASLDVSRRGR